MSGTKEESKVFEKSEEKEERSTPHSGIRNLMFSHNVIDEIWDEEDDTL